MEKLENKPILMKNESPSSPPTQDEHIPTDEIFTVIPEAAATATQSMARL
jgi:hypothetical protein